MVCYCLTHVLYSGCHPQNAMWAAKRNRDRISEIINYIERNIIELDDLAGEEEAGDA